MSGSSTAPFCSTSNIAFSRGGDHHGQAARSSPFWHVLGLHDQIFDDASRRKKAFCQSECRSSDLALDLGRAWPEVEMGHLCRAASRTSRRGDPKVFLRGPPSSFEPGTKVAHHTPPTAAAQFVALFTVFKRDAVGNQFVHNPTVFGNGDVWSLTVVSQTFKWPWRLESWACRDGLEISVRPKPDALSAS